MVKWEIYVRYILPCQKEKEKSTVLELLIISYAAYASIRKRDIPGISISLVVQWLGLGTSTARARVQSLVEELRSCKPLGKAKKKRQTDIPTYTCDLLHPRSLKLEGPQRR